MTKRDEDCLAYGPFDGDRDVDVVTLSDRFVVTRKSFGCHECADVIPPRTRVRSLTEVSRDDNTIGTFRFCPTCRDAMAASWGDDGEAIEERYRVGERNRASSLRSSPGAK